MENISEYAEVTGFSDEKQVPNFDAQGIINTILGTNTE